MLDDFVGSELAPKVVQRIVIQNDVCILGYGRLFDKIRRGIVSADQ